MVNPRSTLVCGLALVLVSCGPPPKTPPPPATVHTTYRVLGGVSMGGIGTAALGLSHPDRFDGLASLGGPLDAAFFVRMQDQFLLSGFCTKEKIEEILAQDPAKLNDPAVMDACAKVGTPMKWEHPNDFNHWHATTNGGSFDRDSYMHMLSDLSLAFGNFLTDNPASGYAPPGVDVAKVKNPAPDFCSSPVKVKGLKNAEYNPQGTYDSITFCDGQPDEFFCRSTTERVDFCSDPANKLNPLPVSRQQAFADAYCATKGGSVLANKKDHPLFVLDHWGRFDACRQPTLPVGVALAVDFNGNGRRDYGEPLVNNSHERYDDVGKDGCADAFEDGKGGCTTTAGTVADPNQDNYDADLNPEGTEQNWTWEQGEPFRDDGLDGVQGTGDSGEGNGAFDMVKGRQKLFAYDGRTNFKKLDDAGKTRLNVLVDGGIHDIFNLGLMAKQLFGAVKAYRTAHAVPVGEYRDFTEIPGMTDRATKAFSPWNKKWKLVPHDLATLYGKERADQIDQDRVNGEGDHVGTAAQAIYRFAVVFNWAAAMWPNLSRPATPVGGSTANERQRITSFDSKKLKAKWEYAIALPPGYDDPTNADARYPVVYMLHGYGMEPKGFMGTSLITDAFVTDTDVQLRPIIYVYPNGRCCWINSVDGARDCRESDDNGDEVVRPSTWARECNSGTFWINRSGYTAEDQTLYGDAFFELMDHVDATYRTLPAADVEAR